MDFAAFWRLGYRRLVPIVPPGAPISPRSTMAKRSGAAGKAVGVRGQDGDWRGFDWLQHDCTPDDLERWQRMGAGVGIRTGDGLVAIDADTLSPVHARAIRDAIEKYTGRAVVRVGKAPKALYPVRTEGGYRYARVEFGGGADPNDRPERVEILSDGRQFVAAGLHPDTGREYSWPRGVPPLEQLPHLTHDQIDSLLDDLRDMLPAAQAVIREGADTVVNQTTLRGEIETVKRAVEATPNSQEYFPTRESYRDFGYAIKAALPDHPNEALALFQDWCARWDGGHNDPDVVEADWRRMKPPYRRGAQWLYEIAERMSNGVFSRADVWFDNLDDDPFATPATATSTADVPSIRWIDPATWAGVEPPERQWTVEHWVPEGEVTLIYGDGGVGKTLAVHQMATCMAAGVDWLGQTTKPGRVMCFFCEDSEEELLRRQVDINRSLALTFDDYSERLRIASRKYMDNLLTIWDRNTGAMKRTAVWERLLADAKAWGAEVIVVDTLADVYSGSEIDRAQVNSFVKSCLGRLAQEISKPDRAGTLIALGHPSMSGKASGSGTSGSTAWSNAARSRVYLRYPEADGAENGNIREVVGMKSNYGPRGGLLKIMWERGAFRLIASTLPGAGSENGLNAFEGAGQGGTVTAMCEAALAAVIELHGFGTGVDGVGAHMALSRRSPRYAGRVLRELEPGLLAPYSSGEVDAALRRLELAGRVEAVEAGRTKNRNSRTTLRLVAAAPGIDLFS